MRIEYEDRYDQGGILRTKKRRNKHNRRNFYKSINGQLGREKGAESEKMVINALSALWLVDNIRSMKRTSKHDKKGRDLAIQLNISLLPPSYQELGLYEVYVQIKSSNLGIADFMKKLSQKTGLVIGPGLDKYLIDKKLIILNGQRDTRCLRNDFLNQLRRIVDFSQNPL